MRVLHWENAVYVPSLVGTIMKHLNQFYQPMRHIKTWLLLYVTIQFNNHVSKLISQSVFPWPTPFSRRSRTGSRS